MFTLSYRYCLTLYILFLCHFSYVVIYSVSLRFFNMNWSLDWLTDWLIDWGLYKQLVQGGKQQFATVAVYGLCDNDK